MNGVVLFTDTKWTGFPIYDAQVGTTGMGLVEVDPDRPYTLGQQVEFAVMSFWGTTPWQNGVITNIVDSYITISGTGTA
jgi:hypothetical protein